VAFERGPAEVGAIARAFRTLASLEAAARHGRYGRVADAGLRLARVRVHLEVLRLHVLRTLSESHGEPPGPESSVGKLMMGQTEQELSRLRLELTGSGALVGDDHDALNDYLHSRALSIYGGTAQIQKNIIAQRVLKMPQE